MKKLFTLLFVLTTLASGNILAQDDAKSEAKKARDEGKPLSMKTKLGVFGNVHAGFTFGFFGKLEKDLQKTEALNENFALRNLGSMYGGAVYGFLPYKIIVGVGGFGTSYNASVGFTKAPEDSKYNLNPNAVDENGDPIPVSETDASTDLGDSRIRTGFVLGYVGYAILDRTRYGKVRNEETERIRQINEFKNKSEYVDYRKGKETEFKEIPEYEYKYRWFLFPYLGIGGGFSRMRVSNFSIDQRYFGTEQTGQLLDRTSYVDFKSNMPIMDLGMGIRFIKARKGGVMLGGEFGGYFNLGGSKWKSVENKDLGIVSKEIADAQKATVQGVYLRFTLGGGFFKVDDPNPQPVKGDDAYVKPKDAEPKAKKSDEAKEPTKSNVKEDKKDDLHQDTIKPDDNDERPKKQKKQKKAESDPDSN